LPKELPAFFRRGADRLSHCSADPDVFSEKVHPELRAAEGPQHYVDLELLKGAELPPTRPGFVALCAKLRVDPYKVGFLPYTVTEWAQRLTMAFAEHRKWPADPHIQAKCLVYGGLLAHYAQDACQPLHTTIHFDGRARPDGTSPRTGIHAKVDDLLHAPSADAREVARKAVGYERLFQAVCRQIAASHALVGRVYELADQVPDMGKPLAKGPLSRLIGERRAAAASFTASLYLTAWRNSAKVKLPEWHRRR
jgi:hypothetical protein